MVANVYGLTSGQEYSGNIKDPGYIDNVWGVRAVGVDNQNERHFHYPLFLCLIDFVPNQR